MATEPLWRGTAGELAETYDGPAEVSLLEPGTELVVLTAEQYDSLVANQSSGFERLPEWFWHPTRGIYGHEEPPRPGDLRLYALSDHEERE